jgi:hypothetical protein
MDWMGLKWFAGQLGLEKDALHIYVAFLIQLGAAWALKRPLGSWVPWLCVLAAALFNEFLDIWFGEEMQVKRWQVDGAIHDMINTMILPTALLFLSRRASGLFRPEQAGTSREQPAGVDRDPEEAVEAAHP